MIENNHFEWSPYTYVYNNPISLVDPFGLDSAQRDVAMKQMQAHEDQGSTYNFRHSAYTDPNGTAPGTDGNCSSAVSNCVVKAGESNPSQAPSSGDRNSGVLNIEANSSRITNNNNIQAGNIITFRLKEPSYQYHTGMVMNVNNNDGSITVTFKHLNSTDNAVGTESFTIGDGSTWDSRTYGFYKWDSRPDISTVAISTAPTNPQSTQRSRTRLKDRIATGLSNLESSIAEAIFKFRYG